jgi:hypothetical protein
MPIPAFVFTTTIPRPLLRLARTGSTTGRRGQRCPDILASAVTVTRRVLVATVACTVLAFTPTNHITSLVPTPARLDRGEEVKVKWR